jgi:hypothetical protein
MFANAGRVASEAVDNIRTLTGLSAQYVFMDKYWRELDGPARKGLRKANISGISFGFTEFAMFGMMAGLDVVCYFQMRKQHAMASIQYCTPFAKQAIFRLVHDGHGCRPGLRPVQ